MFDFLVRLRKRAASYRQQRLNENALAALDDWTLQDIGIRRSNVTSVRDPSPRRSDPYRRL